MAKSSTDRALELLRYLPRVSLGNLGPNPNNKALRKKKPKRGQYGGKTHGHGTKGSGQRQGYMRIGMESGATPFYLRIPCEPYHKGHHLRRQYPPLSLKQLQLMIDTGRLDPLQPIDLTAVCNTSLYFLDPSERHFGIQLTDEGLDSFKAQVNIEVQHAPEPVIAAIERNGGLITTAYYDVASLYAAMDPLRFFKKGVPIPKRHLPPEDAVEYYTNPANRGYLADPSKVAEERFSLAQKYGYQLPNIAEDPKWELLTLRKDPRQIFYGLEPGWVVNIRKKKILKPKDEQLQEYYRS
ncbi:39S ribosomal protein L15, mitochondrial-like [Limulus polyphemus]|uniref:Large ribosomal subunit protein uL15m n=1 Tax=Limulus polyphemus TaxID=6850 RepID=A0ABM1BAB0_LIMPO|nr:39S ribosomal protein L15, mitochondrial-like [Limulus polyphemus]XP_022245593.1 39S ribosomal protein L15, mitochondrial-like [Limulus polyphemus]